MLNKLVPNESSINCNYTLCITLTLVVKDLKWTFRLKDGLKVAYEYTSLTKGLNQKTQG